MSKLLTVLCVVVACGTAVSWSAEPAPPASVAKQTKEQRDARMAWLREAKFGLFIHWGVYSVPAG